MANHTTQFQAWWEYTSSQRASYGISGADLPISVHTPPPDAPDGPEGPTYEVNGVKFTMLTPSPPPTPEDNVEEATPSPEQNAILPDQVPTFTNLDRPVMLSSSSYGAGFVINPSTEGTRLRARAEIFGGTPSPPSGHSSGTPESQAARHWPSELAALQSRTERLQERVKNGLKKVQDSVGRKLRKARVAEQLVFQRLGSVRRRGVKRTKLYTKLLRDAAKATKTHAAVLTGRVTKVDVLRRQSSVRSIRGASRQSLPQFGQANSDVSVEAAEEAGVNMVTAGSSPVDTHVVRQPLTPSSSASNAGISEPANDVLHHRLDEHERTQTMEQLNRRSSIRARMAAFSFNTMVSMEVIRRFEPAQRTATMASNLVVATQDMMQLSKIWSKFVDSAPNMQRRESVNPLLILSDDEAERLCQLMEHGLYCWAYWSLATELSVNEEEVVDDDWLGAFVAQLDDIGRPNTEAIFQQLVDFGTDYINAPHLESVMRKTKCLDVGMSIRRRSTRRVPSSFHNDEVFELDAVETEIKRAAPTMVASVSLGPDTDGPMTRTEEDSQHQLTAEQTANEEMLVFEDQGESAITDEESSLEALVPSSPGILEELNAALNEALDENADVFSEQAEDEPPSQVLPLTTKTNQPAQKKCNGIWPRQSQHKKGQVQHEPASLRLTRENGWISADVLANSSPEYFDLETLLPKGDEIPGPPHMSERARGKLPMARSLSTRVFPGQIVAPPYNGPAVSRTLPRGTTFGKPALKTQTPAAKVGLRPRIPQPRVQMQDVSQAGSPGQTVARSPFVAATMKSSSTAAKAKPTPKTSQTLPRSFTMRPNSNLNSPSPSQSKSDRLETARRLLNASAKPNRSSGAARISFSGTRPSVLTFKASRVPLGPIGRSVTVVDSSVRSSRSPAGAEEVEAEAPRSPSRVTMPIGITNTPGAQKPRLPVPKLPVLRRKAIMPGTYPASDAGADD
ncbi:hypothetical protein E8E11_007977 [Didymella keratinophila]|nr:hypothetical protein E8E11_007977 [Didymella keratinophila]